MGYTVQNTPVATTFATTITGFSALTESACSYYLVGKKCTATYIITGTSNATTFTFTLPFPADDVPIGDTTNAQYQEMVRALNNGTGVAGFVRTRINQSDVVDVYSSVTGGAWTASGTKGLSTTITYTIV